MRLLKALPEGALEEEMTVLMASARFRRTEDRRGHRNGFYERDLATQIGIVTAIRVPRAQLIDPAETESYRQALLAAFGD